MDAVFSKAEYFWLKNQLKVSYLDKITAKEICIAIRFGHENYGILFNDYYIYP